MGPARKRVLDSLGDGGGLLLIATVADRNNISYSSARVHLRELYKTGHVAKTRAHRCDFYYKVGS